MIIKLLAGVWRKIVSHFWEILVESYLSQSGLALDIYHENLSRLDEKRGRYYSQHYTGINLPKFEEEEESCLYYLHLPSCYFFPNYLDYVDAS